MKKPNIQKIILASSLVIYIFGLFLDLTYFFTPLFVLVFLLVSLKKWNFSRIALIFSPIFTFPAYFYILISFSEFSQKHVSSMSLFGYAFIYAYLFRNYWNWVDCRLRKFQLFILSAFTLFAKTSGFLSLSCFGLTDGKGARMYQIFACNLFLKSTNQTKFFGGVKVFEAIFITLPVIFLIFIILYYFSKKRCYTRKN